MFIRKFIVVVCVSLGLALSAGQALAVNKTGQVSWYFVTDQPDDTIYTFVNVSGTICYNISNNAAFATIFSAKQITGTDVSIYCDGTVLVSVTN